MKILKELFKIKEWFDSKLESKFIDKRAFSVSIMSAIIILISISVISTLPHKRSISGINGIESSFPPSIPVTKVQNSSSNIPSNSVIVNRSLTITDPAYPPTIYTKKIIINGTAFDRHNKIERVEAFVHTFPLRGNFTYTTAIPIKPQNWSKWSFPVHFKTPGTYRIFFRSVDDVKNETWAETTINVPFFLSDATGLKLAFVRPSFTEAAYGDHAFYTFYYKYNSTSYGTNITKDLDMLTAPLPVSVEQGQNGNTTNIFSHWSNLTALIPSSPYQKFWVPLVDIIRRAEPSAHLTIVRDEDVNDDHLFAPNGSNLYNILLLLHNEYATQAEYDNLERFVTNGGIIIFLDPDVFYAEVQYNRENHSVTLLKGHDWEYDGNVARKSVEERWYNQTKAWVGGNFLVNTIYDNVSFGNNPFNYTHFEEQFVNNPKDKIILDYKVKFGPNYFNQHDLPVGITNHQNIRIATYELSYGKGKVVMIGLYGQNLAENKAFGKFLGNLVSAS